jgi:hypothetical protein
VARRGPPPGICAPQDILKSLELKNPKSAFGETHPQTSDPPQGGVYKGCLAVPGSVKPLGKIDANHGYVLDMRVPISNRAPVVLKRSNQTFEVC